MTTIYLIIGLAFALFAAYSKEKHNVPLGEFEGALGQFILYGTIAFAWPFLLLYVFRHVKNNS